jgi:hypothetical protein
MRAILCAAVFLSASPAEAQVAEIIDSAIVVPEPAPETDESLAVFVHTLPGFIGFFGSWIATAIATGVYVAESWCPAHDCVLGTEGPFVLGILPIGGPIALAIDAPPDWAAGFVTLAILQLASLVATVVLRLTRASPVRAGTAPLEARF